MQLKNPIAKEEQMYLGTILYTAGLMAFLNGLAVASRLRAVHVQPDAEAGSVEEYHYFGNGNHVQTSNTSLPILSTASPSALLSFQPMKRTLSIP
jgi:hypothetical protein